ncbi:MAG TPA: FecR domain-containing protein [Polyangia bacterium]|nr:FecR domain-containing protein [Polyangia bacterium]
MNRPDDADAQLLAALSEEARRLAAADAADLPRPGAWHRLEQRRAEPRRRRLRWWATGLGLCAASATVVFGLHSWRSGRALTFDVGGGAIVESGYIRGAANAGSPVQFSDGTRIDLAAGARMSVVAPGPHGARLRVEEGAAHFSVMHLPHAAWSVEAGPYLVEVTGTVFDVRWSSADEVVEVRLRSGSVRVSGPLLSEHATLHAGQHLTARLATRELRIDENAGAETAPTLSVPPPAAGWIERTAPPDTTAPPAAAAPPAATAPPATSVETEPAAEAPPPAVGRPLAPARALKKRARAVASVDSPAVSDWAPQRWSTRVSAGDAKGVVAEAVAHGIDAAVADADGAALVALADAARYAGRSYLAERVLRAQRTRFPGTPAAGAAAFFLGRMADDRGAAADGLDWYRRYLTEEPHGTYAAEALGREMIGVARLSGRPAARALALEYLRRFPDGTYLLHAQAILQSP